MQAGNPRWRRRAEARPGEIVQAAFEVFAEKGFAAAKLDEIAARAGISKGALYLYFETKEDIFRAVVREAVVPNLDAVEFTLDNAAMPFPDLLRMLFVRLALMIQASRIGAVAKLVIGESRNFPELARVWHDEVVSRALTALTKALARAQARGEVRIGDPHLQAFSIMGPILMGMIWQETFAPIGAPPLDVHGLITQHRETILAGLAPQVVMLP
ncbi:TetR/AcrR family transcriptional regulator [Caulobacter sp. FWC2]|uniref:TetR/AcrR family transcriptional regulator n=1 Tax=Caulobacter sp. FWC2 TaxID=69664 RepID=UPI000C156EA9|nr:TetR/AcrR family transcriptional regulator [Caulobacter sp. FWC2]PIB94179.1 TetR family transcriptional regulator [Caulobacter sp. FWC2]